MAKRKETSLSEAIHTGTYIFAEPKIDPIKNLNMREEGKNEVSANGRLTEKHWTLSKHMRETEWEARNYAVEEL